MIGVLVSALLFIPRAAKLKISELIGTEERIVRERVPSDPPATGVAIYDLEGELFSAPRPSSKATCARHLTKRMPRVCATSCCA